MEKSIKLPDNRNKNIFGNNAFFELEKALAGALIPIPEVIKIFIEDESTKDEKAKWSNQVKFISLFYYYLFRPSYPYSARTYVKYLILEYTSPKINPEDIWTMRIYYEIFKDKNIIENSYKNV